MNAVCLIGRLGKDPETRTTTTGKLVANFSIAVDDPFNKDVTFWFNVTAWGKTAEFVEKYLTKGRLVGVSGRLTQRKYTTSDGQNRDVVEIVADRVDGLDKQKDDPSSSQNPTRATPVTVPDDEYDPFSDE